MLESSSESSLNQLLKAARKKKAEGKRPPAEKITPPSANKEPKYKQPSTSSLLPRKKERSSLWGKFRKNALQIGLAAGLGVGGGYGVKKTGDHMGWWGSDAPEGKKVVENATTNTTGTNKIYTAPAGTNLSAKAMEIEAKIRAELEKAHNEELAKRKAEYDKKLEEYKRTNSAPAVSLKLTPETVEERLAKIRAKLEKRRERKAGEPIPPEEEITGEDQDFWNGHLK